MADDGFWSEWDAIRRDPNPDPLRVLRAVAQFQAFLGAVEEEATRVARALGHSWESIGEAVGKSRQAVWERAARRGGLEEALRRTSEEVTRRWEVVKQDPQTWYEGTAPFAGGTTP